MIGVMFHFFFDEGEKLNFQVFTVLDPLGGQ